MNDAREAVFIAANVAEAEAVERLFESEGIEYELTPEPFLRGVLTTSCHMGLLVEVLPGQAPYCRWLLRRERLDRGIVEDPGEGQT
jgi:hypothetical protein